jgi:hypothetical protein
VVSLVIDYALAVASLAGDPDDLNRVLDETLKRMQPHPSRLLIFDNGRENDVERMLREQRLVTGTATAIFITGQKRRLSDEAAFGRIWKDAASQSCRYVLLMTDDHVLTRGVDMNDVAYVLDRQPALLALEFAAGQVDAGPGERRGSGSVPWLVSRHLHGWPLLIRTETLRSFRWPRRGLDELEVGMLSSVPASTFGIWGVGDPWAKVT